MDLIQQIRREHGFDHSVPRSQNDPVLLLRAKLERAVERLSYDLYNKKTHFLLEFIQNADDNTYGAGVIPTLKLHMRDRKMTIRCNELGFTAENVRAICDIGGSTKRRGHTQGFIGEKGIGFESVFTIADLVHVNSGPYQFKFDKNLPLGMITPVTDPTPTKPVGWTTFHLHIAPSEDEFALVSQLSKVQPTLLLFLRQLRQMSISIIWPNQQKIVTLRRTDEGDNKVRLDRMDNGDIASQLYLIYKQWVPVPPGQAKREGVEISEIVLAFPVDGDERPVIDMQDIHAFLPLRCYGFSFIIQADFLTSASREDVLRDQAWNVALRTGITTSFLSAVQDFLSHPALRLTWFRFLPQYINDDFFAAIEYDLVHQIQGCLCLLNSSGVFCPPRRLIIPPPRFRDGSGLPLIPEKHLPYQIEYLSEEYDLKTDALILHRIGVLEMSDDVFLAALASFAQRDQFAQQPELWHDALASCLLTLWNTDVRYRTAIQYLKVLPLSDGKWENALLAPNFTFGLEDRDIPDDLGIRTVKAGVSKFSPRYRLYVSLGVQKASPSWIANKILTSKGSKPLRSCIQYARFFFDHRHLSGFPKPLQLRFVGEDGLWRKADELYFDVPFPLDGKESDLRGILPPSAHFIHPEYLTACEGYLREEWIQWLCSVVGLNRIPRVLRGLPSPELLNMSTHLSTPDFLAALRHIWPPLKAKLNPDGCRELSEVLVTCEDGAKYALKSTYLKRGSLLQYADLPFLPVADPTAHHWDFLGDLGVGLHLDVGSMLSILAHMQGSPGMSDKDAVKTIYECLDAEFSGHEHSIRTAFCKPMILIPGEKERKDRWLRSSDVYWKGPRSIRAKTVLNRIYPNLREFFSVKLLILDVPSFALVDEAVGLANWRGGKTILTGTQERAAGILIDLSEGISPSKEPPTSYGALAGQAIFPVRSATRGLMLCKTDEFYVPDTSGRYAEMFGSRVSILALPSSVSVSLLRPLFDMDVFRGKIRYLQTSVQRRSVTRGIRRPDPAAALKYASRVEYVARTICHKQRGTLSERQIACLTQLGNIAFFNVDSITTTVSLEVHTLTSDEDFIFEDDESSSGLVVLVSQKGRPRKPIDPDVCEYLARVLDTDTMSLFMCVSQEMKTLDQLLQLEGIEQLSRQTKEALFHPPSPAMEPVIPSAESSSPVTFAPAPPISEDLQPQSVAGQPTSTQNVVTITRDSEDLPTRLPSPVMSKANPSPRVVLPVPPPRPAAVALAPSISANLPPQSEVSQRASAEVTATKDPTHGGHEDLSPNLSSPVASDANPEPHAVSPPLPPRRVTEAQASSISTNSHPQSEVGHHASAQVTATKDTTHDEKEDLTSRLPSPLMSNANPKPRTREPPPPPPRHVAVAQTSSISTNLPPQLIVDQRTSARNATTNQRESEDLVPRYLPSPVVSDANLKPRQMPSSIEATSDVIIPPLPLEHLVSFGTPEHNFSPSTASPRASVHAPPYSPPASTKISSGSSSPLYGHLNKRRVYAQNISDSWTSPQAAGSVPIHAQRASEDEVTFAPQGGWVRRASSERSQILDVNTGLSKRKAEDEMQSRRAPSTASNPGTNPSVGRRTSSSTTTSGSLPSISTDNEGSRRSANAPEANARTVPSAGMPRSSQDRIDETATLVSRLSLTSGSVHGVASRIPAPAVREDLQSDEVLATPVGGPSTQETDEVGLLGEYFIYQLLLKELGSGLFGMQNWTSSLRSLIPGFPAFNGDASADFTYVDRTGALTGIWYRKGTKHAWRGRYPTYHIEVKSTTSVLGEPFHVSQRQMASALKFTQRDPRSPPTDVFVLIRVSGLSTTAGPSFAVYCDLHRCLYRGELHFASGVQMMIRK